MPSYLLSYKFLSLSIAMLWFILSICLLIVPDFIYWMFEIVGNDATDLMSKRAAMLFLGLSILAFASRNEPISSLRQMLSLAFGVTMLGLMCMGIFEFVRDQAGLGIWLAVAVELVFSIAFFVLWRRSSTEEEPPIQ